MAFPALAVAGVLAGGSLLAGASARRRERRAARVQQRIRERQERREKISQLREGMIQRAQIIAAGAAGGAIESSSVQGGAGSVQSQVASNIAFIDEISGLQTQQQRLVERAGDFRALSSALGAGASLATSFASPTPPTLDVGTAYTSSAGSFSTTGTTSIS